MNREVERRTPRSSNPVLFEVVAICLGDGGIIRVARVIMLGNND